MKNCKNCGTVNTPDSLYCENCGNKLEVTLLNVKTDDSGLIARKKGDSTVKDAFLCILIIVAIVIAFLVINFIFSLIPDIIQLIIALVSLIIFISCILKLILGSIEEIRDRKRKKRRENDQNLVE